MSFRSNSMYTRVKSIIAKIKSSALMQPQNRWLLRTCMVVVGIALTMISYHYMSLGWDGSYSASRTRGGDYSVLLMFPKQAFWGFLLAIAFASGYTAILYAITLPRVKQKNEAKSQ